jgi:predicted RND superfamily exporter protein
VTRFNQLVVRWPKLTVLLALLVTAFLGYEARHFRFNSSVENLYDLNDPNKKYDEAMRARFGSDDMGVIGLVADNVYTPGTLEKIRRLTTEVEKLEGVASVKSLTNVPDLIADLTNPPPLIPPVATDPAVLDALRRKLLRSIRST